MERILEGVISDYEEDTSQIDSFQESKTIVAYKNKQKKDGVSSQNSEANTPSQIVKIDEYSITEKEENNNANTEKPEENEEKRPVWLSFGKNNKPQVNHVLLADTIGTEIEIYKNNRVYKFFDHKSGIWKDNARQFLKTYTIEKLGSYSKKSIVEEVLFQLENKFHQNHDNNPFESSDPYLIALKNGTYDLKRKEFSESFTPFDYIQTKHNITYIEDAECPRIEAFLKQVAGEDSLPFLYEWFGFQLIRKYDPQAFLFLLGTGGTGKSKLIELLQAFVGPQNVSNYSLDVLLTKDFSRSGLYTKSANMCADIDPKYMSSPGLFKQLTGNDVVNGDVKYEKPIEFKNYAKFTFSMNQLPTLSDFTDGMKRRTLILPMDRKIPLEKRNDNIIEEITTETELAGLLNKAVEGVQRLLKNKWFSVTYEMENAANNWFEESDIVQQFILAECEADKMNSKLFTHADTLFLKFDQYRSEAKAKEITKQTFYKRMATLGYPKKKKNTSTESYQAIYYVKHKQQTR